MSAIDTRIDHIVIVAATLKEGIDFCERMLGATLVKGGEHAQMGTHNYLLNLGDGVYLEVIAVNPAAREPDCPRWFGMDSVAQRKRVAAGPFLATFVARTNGIAQAVEALPQLGTARDMQRGELAWQITIREDGDLVEGGALPTVIQWPQDVHPTQTMPESRCSLQALEVFHPRPDSLRAAWARIGLQVDGKLILRQASGDTPSLVARLATPNGAVELR